MKGHNHSPLLSLGARLLSSPSPCGQSNSFALSVIMSQRTYPAAQDAQGLSVVSNQAGLKSVMGHCFPSTSNASGSHSTVTRTWPRLNERKPRCRARQHSNHHSISTMRASSFPEFKVNIRNKLISPDGVRRLNSDCVYQIRPTRRSPASQ